MAITLELTEQEADLLVEAVESRKHFAWPGLYRTYGVLTEQVIRTYGDLCNLQDKVAMAARA